MLNINMALSISTYDDDLYFCSIKKQTLKMISVLKSFDLIISKRLHGKSKIGTPFAERYVR